jgi:hypothetical protein
MAALTEDRNTMRKDGKVIPLPVVANDCIFGGSLTAVNAAGYLNPGSDTAGLIFAGVADDRADNTGGAAGDINCNVRRHGLYLFAIAAATVANIGDDAYLVDDQTVGLAATTTNDIKCGTIWGVESATSVWVDIGTAF